MSLNDLARCWAASEILEESRHSLASNPAHDCCSADRAAVAGMVAMHTDMLPLRPTPQYFHDRLLDIRIASKYKTHPQVLNGDLNTRILPIVVWLRVVAHTRDK